MLGLFSRTRRKDSAAKADRFRPTLESLEARDCPSTISIMMAYCGQNRMVTLYGQVSNTPTPGGLTVALTGQVNGSATTDSNGSFHTTLQAAALGTVYAATSDGQSNTAQTTLMDTTPPSINTFGYMVEPNGFFEFIGHVNNGCQGEVVNFGGLKDLKGQTATLDSNGSFEILVRLDGQMDDSGNATAQVTDSWGVASNLALTWVMQT